MKSRQHRHRGSTLLVTMFLSVIILSVGLKSAEMVIKELNFSSDLLFGEQSYYAAESGVETALMELQNSATPAQHVELTDPVEFVQSEVVFWPNIDYRVLATESFLFTVTPLKTRRFRLIFDNKDGLGSAGYEAVPSHNFNLEVSPKSGLSWQWRLLCQDANGRTHAMQNTEEGTDFVNFLSQVDGLVEGGALQKFNLWVNGLLLDIPAMETETCIFSLQNLSDQDIKFTVTPQSAAISPVEATVTAVGQAGSRQKQINFNYEPQLGGLFDFVFFHWEGVPEPDP